MKCYNDIFVCLQIISICVKKYQQCAGVQVGVATAWMDLDVVVESGERGRCLTSLSP